MARTIDPAGLELIKRFEGCKLDAYQDVVGIWTIGYGHIRGVEPGMHFTQAQCDQALQDDLQGAEAVVASATAGKPTNDNQFAAMVSLCYNVGSANYRSSSVLSRHLAGNFDGAADAFLMWNKARVSGVLQPVTGLTNRRTAERALYLS